MREFAVVVAATLNNGIGIQNRLPWRLSADMKHFARLTTAVSNEGARNAVIMGRKTYESLPSKFRPLPNRLNVVLSRSSASLDLPEGVLLTNGLPEALALIDAQRPPIERVFVIGGAAVYEAALAMPQCRDIYLTRIMSSDIECDVFFPSIDERHYVRVDNAAEQQEGDLRFTFHHYRRNQSIDERPLFPVTCGAPSHHVDGSESVEGAASHHSVQCAWQRAEAEA